MKRVLSYCLIGVVLVSGVFWGCSDKKEPAAEKGAIKNKKAAMWISWWNTNPIPVSDCFSSFGCAGN